MSSSTSSSEMTLRGRALRIALMFVVALVLVEVGTRQALVPVSRDLDRLSSFPDRARSLAAAPAPRIVFIGDSVTDRVELERIKAEWEAATGDSLAVDKFVAYNSNLATWYWMSEQYFWKRDLKPDLIVVTYYDEMGLADSQVLDVGNLARFFTDADDRPTLFEHDLKTFRQRADYMLSSVSLAYAMRDRIRVRTIHLIPRYKAVCQRRPTSSISSTSRNTLRSPSTPLRRMTRCGVSSRGRGRRASCSASLHSGRGLKPRTRRLTRLIRKSSA